MSSLLAKSMVKIKSQKLFQRRVKKDYKVEQLRQSFISKCGKHCFKVRQRLPLQSVAIISKWNSYLIVGQNVISE